MKNILLTKQFRYIIIPTRSVLYSKKKMMTTSLLNLINYSTLIFFLFLSTYINSAHSYSNLNETQQQQLLSLKETITALDITREKSYTEKQKLIEKQELSLKKTIEDYSVFINFLSFQIQSYCNDIMNNYGSDVIDDLPCYLNNSNTNELKYNRRQIKTASEEIESLDNEFIESMGEFDEMLLKEDELARNITRSNSSSGGQNNSNQTASLSGIDNSNGKQKSETESSSSKEKNDNWKESDGEENNREQSGSETLGKQKKSSKINSREKRRLDKIDDDIVARQLKEAAEKERDPKLKEKLWNEYYNYKRNNSR